MVALTLQKKVNLVIQIETFEREKKEGGWEGGREREKSNRSRWGGG